MNGRLITMLLVALVFAGIAAFIAKVWVNKQVTKSPDIVASSLVMSATEIPFGVKLENTHLKVINWPGKDIPKGSFDNIDDVIGKITKNSFYSGEIITKQRIVEHLGGSTLSSLITKNSRAISIRVNDIVGVAGFVLPGNRVDILSIKRSGAGGSKSAKARTILENIKVLAVDQMASPDKEKPAVVRAVTLELKPEEAETLAEAMQEGKIQLTLRNPLDSNAYARKGETKPAIKRHRVRGPSVAVVPW